MGDRQRLPDEVDSLARSNKNSKIITRIGTSRIANLIPLLGDLGLIEIGWWEPFQECLSRLLVYDK